MAKNQLRILYLSNAFPPGVNGRFPALCSHASHATETRMTQALARQAQVSTVGLMPALFYGQLEPRDNSLGVEHELHLWDRKPELWHRWQSGRQLRQYYLEKTRREGIPDIVLVRNLQPVFNPFVKWLRGQRPRPTIVVVLADSGLGQPISFSRRLRYRFKPLQHLEDEAALWYDACLGFGIDTRRHFEPRGIPWQWMPSAFNFDYEPPPVPPAVDGPIRFGYFGGLSEHIGVQSMVRNFLESGAPATMRVCGPGNLTNHFKELAAKHPNFKFDGLLPKQSDCLVWAQQVDVLINPRPPLKGQDNSFPSKLFEFGVTGRAILSSRTGGADQVLGDEAMYFETDNFDDSLKQRIREVAGMDRAELLRRGTAIRQRMLTEYNWDAQAGRIIQFLERLKASPEHARRIAA